MRWNTCERKTVNNVPVTTKFIWALAGIYFFAYALSIALWSVFEDDKKENVGGATVAFLLGLIFLGLFSYFEKHCDWVAPMLMVLLPVLVIIIDLSNLDAMMISPLSYGWAAANRNHWKPYWEQK